MKHKRLLGFISLLMCVVLSVSLAACSKKKKTLESISLDTQEVKTSFVVGDEFTYEGLVVTAHYSDESTKTVTEYTVSDPDMSTAGVKSVTVTYEQKTANYDITVFADKTHTLNSITLDTSSVKKSFTVGDTFTYEGLVVTAHYNDNTTDTVTGYTVTGYDMDEADEYELTVSYTEGEITKTANYTITVSEPTPVQHVLQSITLDTSAVKKNFNIGDEFTHEGLVVTAHYDDNTSKSVTGYTVTGYDMDEADEYELTVSYTENGVTKTANYTIAVSDPANPGPVVRSLTGIVLNTDSVKKNFVVGENFTCVGLIVTAKYDVGDDKILDDDDYEVDGYNMNVADEYELTVSYTENGVTKTAKYSITVSNAPVIELDHIEVNADGAEKYFALNEEFSYDGLEVTAYFTDGSSKVLDSDEYDVDEPDTDEAGTKEVTVSYTKYQTTKSDTYKIIVMAGYGGGEEKYTAKLADINSCENQTNAAGTDGSIIAAINGASSFTYTINSTATKSVEIILAAAGKLEPNGAVEGALQLFVNGSAEAVADVTIGTNDYTNFTQIFVCYAELSEGRNVLEFRAKNANGNVNIDYLLIAEELLYTGAAHKYGAGVATFEREEGENLPQSNAGAWDGKFYGGIKTNDTITYTINSTVAGYVDLSVSVAGGIGEGMGSWTGALVNAFEVIVNDISLGTLSVGPNGWTGFEEISVGCAYLEEGENTVQIVIGTIDGSASAGLNFNYLAISAPVRVFTGITIDTEPTKKAFFVGDSFTFDGIVVTAHYSLAPVTVDVTSSLTLSNFTGYNMNVAGTYTVTVTYEDETATYQITVRNVELEEITLDTDAVQKEFTVGESFNYDYLVVTAHYNNGTTRVLDEAEDGYTVTVSCSNKEQMEEGEFTVTVSYTEGSITKDAEYGISVTTITVVSFTVDYSEAQTEFYQYDEFNHQGLKINVVYSNSPDAVVVETGFAVSTPDMTVYGEGIEVTVTFRGVTAKYTINIIERIVVDIEVDETDAQTEFRTRDTFSYDGIKVSVIYNSGKSEEISEGYTVSNPDMNEPGTKTVTVTYNANTDLTDTYEITVIRVLDHIAVDASSANTEFAKGDEFTHSGIVVTAHYHDEWSEEIHTGYTVTGYDMDKLGVQTVTVTYEEETATYDILVMGVFERNELKIEAEDAILSGDCHAQENDTGSGGKIVGGIGNGDTITFKFVSKVSQVVALYLGGNGDGSGHFSVTVNGGDVVNRALTFDTTGGNPDSWWWTDWAENFVCYLELKANVTYSVEFTSEMISANVDYLKVVHEEPKTYNGGEFKLGADDAYLNGGQLQNNGSAGHGETIIGGLGEGKSIKFYFIAENDCTVDLKVFIAGGFFNNDWGVDQERDATIVVAINGNEKSYSFHSNHWEEFGNYITERKIELKAGLVTIEFSVEAGNFNFDYLKIAPTPTYTGSELTLGAGSAELEGNIIKLESIEGFAGAESADGYFVGAIGEGDKIAFTFDSTVAGTANLKVLVDSYLDSAATFKVKINDGEYVDLSVDGQTGLLAWEEAVTSITLKEGINTIEIMATSGGFNFNCVTISPINS